MRIKLGFFNLSQILRIHSFRIHYFEPLQFNQGHIKIYKS
jgi:hypothetical protein